MSYVVHIQVHKLSSNIENVNYVMHVTVQKPTQRMLTQP